MLMPHSLPSQKSVLTIRRTSVVFKMLNRDVLGSSVLPKIGWVNPTFTITALSLRLSDNVEKARNAR